MDAKAKDTDSRQSFEASAWLHGSRAAGALLRELMRRDRRTGDFLRPAAILQMWRDPRGRRMLREAGPQWRAMARLLGRVRGDEEKVRQSAVLALHQCLARDAARLLDTARHEAREHVAEARHLSVMIRHKRLCARPVQSESGAFDAAIREGEAALRRAEAYDWPARQEEMADALAIRAVQFLGLLFGFRADRLAANLVTEATGFPLSERRVRHVVEGKTAIL